MQFTVLAENPRFHLLWDEEGGATVFHAKRVECANFHLLVNISGILHARPTYDISSRSPIFGDHCDTNDKVSHDSHVTQLAEEVTRF